MGGKGFRMRKQFNDGKRTNGPAQTMAALIRLGRGIVRRTPRGNPLKKEWGQHKKQERAIEERHVG